MRIVKTYSHLNGMEFLMVRRPGMWEEIESVIQSVDAPACRTKVSKEKRMLGQIKFDPRDMNRQFEDQFRSRGWETNKVTYWVTGNERLIRRTLPMNAADQKREIEQAGEQPILSYNQTDFVKDRVAVEVQFGKYAFVAYDLFVKHLAFYVGDKIDVGVEILPMKELQENMSSGPGYYEGELYNVIRNGRGVPSVPLVIIGIAP